MFGMEAILAARHTPGAMSIMLGDETAWKTKKDVQTEIFCKLPEWNQPSDLKL
jgi:hypothetical protein